MKARAHRSSALFWVLLLLISLQGPLVAQEKGKKGEPEKKSEGDAKNDNQSKSLVDPDGGPVTAFHVGRAIPVASAPVDDAVILVQDGRIVAIGKQGDVEIPDDAEMVDAKGHTALPGLVSPASVLLTGKRSFSISGRGTSGDKKVSESLKPTVEDLKALLRSGYTTVAVVPTGGGLTGLGCLLRPLPDRKEAPEVAEFLREDGVLLSMGFSPGTATKDQWTKSLEKARAYIKDRDAYESAKKNKKPAKKSEDKKKPEKKDDKKSGDGKKASDKKKSDDKKKSEKKDDKKSDEKKLKEPKKDSKLMPLVEVLEKKQVGLLNLQNAVGLLHFEAFFKKEKDFRPSIIMAPAGMRTRDDAWRVVDQLEKLGVPVIMTAATTNVPRSRARRVSQRRLLDARIPLALTPAPGRAGLERFRYDLLQLLRHGLRDREIWRAVTLTPAEILGIQDRCGSLEPGKDADMILFDGDPLAPTSRLMQVFVGGESIYEYKEGSL